MIDWEHSRAIVTGGAGFIGSHVVDLLAERGAYVTVFDDLRRGVMGNVVEAMRSNRVRLYADDLADCVPVWWHSGGVVFHLAARVTNIAQNRGDHLGMMQDNLRINSTVIEAIRHMNPELVVLCSTVCVYPHDAPIPTKEADAFPFHPEPTNEGYGLAKCILEKQGEYLVKALGVPTVVTRFSNAIGPRDYYDRDSSHVVPALIRRIMEGEDPLRVWGTGNQTRVFVDARDLATALVRLAETPEAHDARPVNIGHEREISILKLARLVARICGKPNIQIECDPSYPDGHARRAVDNTRLRGLLGWVPNRPLEETIADMVAEYRAGRAHL